MAAASPIKIGVLEAGAGSDGMAARHGRFSRWIENILTPDTGNFTFQPYRSYLCELPATPADCDAYVVTGSAASTGDGDPWIAQLSAFVATASREKPVIGICFGHHLLHRTFGGTVEKSTKGWGIGVHEYALESRAEWMEPALPSMRLRVSHSEQVVAMAPDATVIARSDFCPYAMTTIGDNILTIQGHPDHTHALSADIFTSRRATIGDDHVDRALQSLTRDTDETHVAQWMARFISTRAK